MPSGDQIFKLAQAIDPERTRELAAELGPQPLGVLLGVAYPALTPVLGWQRDAIQRIADEGWRARRERSDAMSRLLAAAGDLSDDERMAQNLRRAVWAEKARIALRELVPARLGGASIEVTAQEISELAEAALEVALAEAHSHVERRFGTPRSADGGVSKLVAFGMGKLGGLELNAGSDVDLVFFYDSDEGGSELSLHEHWSRVVRRVVATLEEPTPDGLVWRIDLRLRPEGGKGPLVNSVPAAERYYETWGRLWERAALLRARPVAGDLELGARIERELVIPFVYRRNLDPGIATALADLVLQSRLELSVDPARDLKLGPGGIREAEFFVQSLQLIWGGRDPTLRVQSTLQALARLRSRGLVSDLEARGIAEGYAFLRTLEHRVQWMTGVQTHLMPEEAESAARLARSLSYRDRQALDQQLAAHRQRIGELFASLLPEAPRPPSRHTRLIAQLDDAGPELSRSAEELFGSADIGDHLAALARRPDALLGGLTRERYPQLADRVLEAFYESADPEQSARFLRAFFARFPSPTAYVTQLAESEVSLRRLTTVLGASAFVGEAIVNRPDLVRFILTGGNEPPDAAAVVASELVETQRLLDPEADEWESRDRVVYGLRRAKRRVMLEVAVADLAEVVDTRQATRVLSDLADETLNRAAIFELGEPPRGLAIIAVGKLGGREIGYGSDLDVLFVFDARAAPEPDEAQHFFVKTAQRIIRLISEPHQVGPGYELDTRLRPSGSQGMLVTSLDSFARYHGVAPEMEGQPSVRSSGAAWERQALIRARACAGDLSLGARVIAVAERAAYLGGAPPAEELHRLRLRMQAELADEREGRHDLKTGHGGLLDIEFCAQWLQMRHGADPRVRTPDTLQALEALSACGYLRRADYEVLREGYSFLRRLEQRMHVLRGTGTTALHEGRPGLIQLGRRMGIQVAPRETLLARYSDVTRSVRRTYLDVLGVEE